MLYQFIETAVLAYCEPKYYWGVSKITSKRYLYIDIKRPETNNYDRYSWASTFAQQIHMTSIYELKFVNY